MQFSPDVLGSLVVGLTAVGLGIYCWNRRKTDAVTALALLNLCMGVWALSFVVYLSASSTSVKVIACRVPAIVSSVFPVLWLAFALAYADKREYLKWQWLALFSCISVVSIVLMITNDLHHLIWTDYSWVTKNIRPSDPAASPGPWTKMRFLNWTLLNMVAIVTIASAAFKAEARYRLQALTLLLAGSIPMGLGAAMWLVRLPPDSSLYASAISLSLFGLAVFRMGILGLKPMARETVLDNLVDAVLILDPQVRLVDLNLAGRQLLRVTKDDFVGANAAKLLPALTELTEIARVNGSASQEVLLEVDGEHRHHDARVSLVSTAEGDVLGHAAVLYDITERKHAQEQLEHSFEQLRLLDQQKNDLTNMIVHDLRTPLTSIITGLQTMEMMGDLDVDQTEMLGMALVGGQNLLNMINDLLDISKMEDGSLVLDRTDLDAGQVCQAALAQLGPLASERDQTLTLQIEDGLPRANADEDKLRRIVTNIIGNSLKFTPSGGSVTLKVQADGQDGGLLFSVTDTGEGIPPEAFGKIFERFGQVETRKAGRKMSTGLGLTFCKMAVEAHGGRIWVESELGKGTTFSFTIPQSSVAS